MIAGEFQAKIKLSMWARGAKLWTYQHLNVTPRIHCRISLSAQLSSRIIKVRLEKNFDTGRLSSAGEV